MHSLVLWVKVLIFYKHKQLIDNAFRRMTKLISFFSQVLNQVNMDRKSCFCVFFIVLLISPGLILAKTMKDLRESKTKRQALLPIWAYAGATVSVPLFVALVAVYGFWAVTKLYRIRKGNNKNLLPTPTFI